MNEWIKHQVPHLSDDQLHTLALDVERRIGSHSAGGQADEHYLNKQRSILDAIQAEFERRRLHE